MEIPKIGLTFSRDLMPQIMDQRKLIQKLKEDDISYKNKTINPKDLRSSQQEFDMDKVASMMIEPYKSKSDIIISNDNYILDGHHRWLVALNRNQNLNVLCVDLPILELMRVAKSLESVTYKPVVECVKNVIKESLRKKIY